MPDTLHVQYIVNCGLLVWTENTKLLIDGIHGSAGLFSEMSDQTENALMNALEPYDHIDWLMFTHGHPDHFDWKKTEQYLKRNHTSGILLPPESGYSDCRITDVEATAQENGIEFLHPDLQKWQSFTFRAGDFTVTQMYIPHSGKEYSGIRNTALLLQAGRKCLYIAGDSDYADPGHSVMLQNIKIDWGFFNPYYQLIYSGRKIIASLDIDKVFIYHIPYEKDDRNSLYSKTVRAVQRFGDAGRPAVVLQPDTLCINCEL